MPEPLSKSQIRNIMRAEHKSQGITKINPGLYRALNRYLGKLHEAYLEAHAENKTQKALTLTKEIRDTERDISTIYELRERKILFMAQDIVRGGAPSLKHLFPEEKLLLLRLSSILLAMRNDIKIDFHHRVDNYIKTIAKEYDLERKMFAPFHPTDPFCEDLTSRELQPTDAIPTPIEHETVEANSYDDEQAIAQEIKTPVTEGIEDGNGVEAERIEVAPMELAPKLTDPADVGEDKHKVVDVEGKPEVVETEPEGETGDGDQAGIEEEGNRAEVEGEDDDDEPDSVDFLRENSVVGTLDSIPQFRGSDLHDYRFEAGEILTLPTKMAEVLEKQGKLFIIDVDKK